jgi:hypothetical protein
VTDQPRDAVLTPARQVASVTDLGTLEWCWARLLTSTEGMLFSHAGLRPPRLAVRYSVEDGQVQIPMGSFPGAALLVGSQVTLGLAGHAGDGLRWVVRASGVAQLSTLTVDSLDARRDRRPARYPVPEAARTLLLDVDRLRGYHRAPSRTRG